MQHRPVKHHCNDPGNKRSRHLRASVCRRARKNPEPEYGFFEMKQALFPAENKQARHCCHRISKSRRNRRAADPHVEYGNKHIVKHHIQDTACHGTDQGKTGLFTRNHIKREIIHKKDRHGKYQIPA